MKKAIVLGATGGVGNPLTAELVRRGIETIAFGRSMTKLNSLAEEIGSSPLLKLRTGDAFKPEDIIQAAEGADVIFHSANIPYHEMESRLLPLGESVMQAAQRLNARVVVVDGIYPGDAEWRKLQRSTRSGLIPEKARPGLPMRSFCFRHAGNPAPAR
ncbi:hypothetical protein PALA111701_18985 [Paenibacillus lactis]